MGKNWNEMSSIEHKTIKVGKSCDRMQTDEHFYKAFDPPDAIIMTDYPHSENYYYRNEKIIRKHGKIKIGHGAHVQGMWRDL